MRKKCALQIVRNLESQLGLNTQLGFTMSGCGMYDRDNFQYSNFASINSDNRLVLGNIEYEVEGVWFRNLRGISNINHVQMDRTPDLESKVGVTQYPVTLVNYFTTTYIPYFKFDFWFIDVRDKTMSYYSPRAWFNPFSDYTEQHYCTINSYLRSNSIETELANSDAV